MGDRHVTGFSMKLVTCLFQANTPGQGTRPDISEVTKKRGLMFMGASTVRLRVENGALKVSSLSSGQDSYDRDTLLRRKSIAGQVCWGSKM